MTEQEINASKKQKRSINRLYHVPQVVKNESKEFIDYAKKAVIKAHSKDVRNARKPHVKDHKHEKPDIDPNLFFNNRIVEKKSEALGVLNSVSSKVFYYFLERAS